jgi:exopolysaccharide biosynthesis protein
VRRRLPAVRFIAGVGVVMALLAVSDAGVGSARGQPARFVTVAPGIAHATFEAQADGAETFSGHAFNVDLDVADLRLVPAGGPSSRRPVAEIVAAYPAVVAINASFFDTDGSAMGLAVDGGRVIAGGKRRSWGALVIDDRNARIVLGAEIKDDHAHRLVVQGIPRLVVGGKVQPLKPQVAERTAVCARGNVVVLVVSTKVEATSFARFLADPPDQGGLGCWDALNLDGGPSTQLVVKLPALSLSLRGGWGVPNALVVVPRQM